MERGDRVREVATGEEGVLQRVSGDVAHISFPTGTRMVGVSDLEEASAEPDRRLIAGMIGDGARYQLRIQADYLRHAHRNDPVAGLSNARVEPMAHQVFIAHRVASKLQPRMILADEVGLGKTVEAGLILKELRARALVERALIICPANLQLQWQSELVSKFNERFEVLDGAAAKTFGRSRSNPFEAVPNAICSLHFAARDKQAQQITAAAWDLVIVDEAHRARRWLEGRAKVKVTKAYKLVDELKEHANGLLLLTATPMQLHDFELFSLIELVEPGLYPNYDHYKQSSRELPALNDLMRRLQRWPALDPGERMDVESELHQRTEIAGLDLEDGDNRQQALDAIGDRHPLAQVLVRNRKAEIGGFMSRRAHLEWVDLTEEEERVYQAVTSYISDSYERAMVDKNITVGFVMVTYQKMLASSSYAIHQSFVRRISKLKKRRAELRSERDTKLSGQALEEIRESEELSGAVVDFDGSLVDPQLLDREIEELQLLVEELGALVDTKGKRLVALVKELLSAEPDSKVLIFTQFIETQDYLRRMLAKEEIEAAIFNGKLKLDDKEDAVRRFKRDVPVMISTEAGGEGRNFQFCHQLINFDLPWNPMRVEQRIGRLDRYGQKNDVEIFNLACRGTVEERVLLILHERVRLFEESVGSLDPILGSLEEEFESLAMSAGSDSRAFAEFGDSVERRVKEAQEKERLLGDFALDRSSFRRDEANRLLGLRPLADHNDLQRFLEELLENYGGGLSTSPEGDIKMSFSPALRQKLGITSAHQIGAIDPMRAREDESLDFLALGHRVIDRLIAVPQADTEAVTGARTDPTLGGGTFLETWWTIEVKGLLNQGRFLRHVVGEDGSVRSEQVTALPASTPTRTVRVAPRWAEAAFDASQLQFQVEFKAHREALLPLFEERRAEELKREHRLHSYRTERLTEKIAREEAWIAEKQVNGTDNDRRVLPARIGQVVGDRKRLDDLVAEHETRVQEIAERSLSVQAQLVACGLVVNE